MAYNKSRLPAGRQASATQQFFAFRFTLFAGLLLNLFFSTGLLFAESASVTATARALPPKAKIGDEIRLVIQVERPKKLTLRLPSEKSDVRPFEIKKVEKLPGISGTRNRPRETFVVTLTAFELGDLNIPSVAIPYRDASGKEGGVRTEPVPVKIVSVGKKPTDKDDIRPIKGPVSTPLARLRTLVLSLFALALLGFLGWRLYRRGRRAAVDPETLKPPHERALLELERLHAKKFLDHNKVKEFYSELSDILRRYLERRFGIETFELTTSGALARLKEKVEPSVTQDAGELLETSDLVKFAKHIPERPKGEALETVLKRIVEATKQAEETKA